MYDPKRTSKSPSRGLMWLLGERAVSKKPKNTQSCRESPLPPCGENLAGLMSTSWKVQKKHGRKEERGEKGKQEKVGRKQGRDKKMEKKGGTERQRKTKREGKEEGRRHQ